MLPNIPPISRKGSRGGEITEILTFKYFISLRCNTKKRYWHRYSRYANNFSVPKFIVDIRMKIASIVPTKQIQAIQSQKSVI